MRPEDGLRAGPGQPQKHQAQGGALGRRPEDTERHQGRRDVVAQPGGSKAQPRRGLPEAHRRGASRRPRRGKGGGMNPRVVGANLVVSIKSFYREKTAMFFTMAFPIILILVFGTIFMDQENVSFHLSVQDLDHTDSSAQLVHTLELNGKFQITKVEPAINATEYAKNNNLNLVLMIPEGYERSFVQRMMRNGPGATATITYISDPSSTTVP